MGSHQDGYRFRQGCHCLDHDVFLTVTHPWQVPTVAKYDLQGADDCIPQTQLQHRLCHSHIPLHHRLVSMINIANLLHQSLQRLFCVWSLNLLCSFFFRGWQPSIIITAFWTQGDISLHVVKSFTMQYKSMTILALPSSSPIPCSIVAMSHKEDKRTL